MKALEIIKKIDEGFLDDKFTLMYGKDNIDFQKKRYLTAINEFEILFGKDRDLRVFSAPGRTEIGGNHTDHNQGRVLAASINLDIIGIASKSKENLVRVQSAGFDLASASWDSKTDLLPIKEENNSSPALIRGLVSSFVDRGHDVGGFDLYTTSDVLKGSGLSSSAAFEVLIGNVINTLYGDNSFSPIEIAVVSQYAENVFFGKPSGLMDQMASSVGGIITIDFKNPEKAKIKEVDFDFSKNGYSLCIVDTGGNHADLTPEYASIPIEMKDIATSLKLPFLREVSIEKLIKNMPMLREEHGDRAVLRAFHFILDNERVEKQVNALESEDFEAFKKLVIESGHSSFEFLQNVYPISNPKEQGLSLALCMAQLLLDGKGAWRVHGGGFAGTTQNFVPIEMVDEFKKEMESVFGKDTCHILKIRPFGGINLL